MNNQSFARWKWALVALLGLFIWQFVHNAEFITLHALRALGVLEAYAAWFPAFMAVIALIITLAGFHVLYLWPGNGLPTLGFTKKRLGRDFLIGLAVALAQAALSLFVIIPLLGDRAEEVLSSVSGLFESPERLIASIVLVVLYGGFVEEIFFRGHIITSVSKALGGRVWSLAIAFMLSVGLFAGSHDYQGYVGMAYSLFAASIWAVLFIVTRRLTISITAHAIYDLLTLVGIYFLYSEYVGA